MGKKTKRKIRNSLLKVLIAAMLTMIPVILFGQSIFDSTPDSINPYWLISLLLGVLILVVGWLAQRLVRTLDKLEDRQDNFSLRDKAVEHSILSLTQANKSLQKQTNVHRNWIHEHINVHASCSDCPPVNKMTYEAT